MRASDVGCARCVEEAPCPSWAPGPLVALVAVATAHLLLGLARVVSFLRAADNIHFLEATSRGAPGVHAGFWPAHKITFARGSRALCKCVLLSLLRHIVPFLRCSKRRVSDV